MPRNPAQKTIDNPRLIGGMDILYNNVVPYDVPLFADGALWRYVSYKQPVFMDCVVSMVMFAQSLPWDIRAVEAKDNNKLEDKIRTYKKIFKDAGGSGRLNHMDKLIQDYYMIPFGGASEAVKYTSGELYKMVNIDAATLYPTNNPNLPVMQKVGAREPVFYKSTEIVRMFQNPRTEIERQGWGMTPVEKVYLAIELLSRGDRYYAQLLLDTPEAGLLDLGDMSKESAEAWLASFKNLVTGIDAFKIPVLYQHTVPAHFIPFGRPPTDLMFDDITHKYAQLVCAAFGITTSDIGLKAGRGGGGALSSALREERHSRSTGYGSLKAHLTEYYNSFLPEDLEYVFIDADDEVLVSKGRARSANSVGMRNLVEAGIMTPDEARDQMVADGLITIPLKQTPQASDFDIIKDISGLTDQLDIQQQQVDIQNKQVDVAAKQATMAGAGGPKKPGSVSSHKIGGQGGSGLNKQRNLRGGKLENVQGKDNVPASQGGQGEIKSDYDEFATFIHDRYNLVLQGMNKIRARRLIKSAIKRNYSMIQLASHKDDYEAWKVIYLESLFNQRSNSNIEAQVKDFLPFVQSDDWYKLNITKAELEEFLTQKYNEGLFLGATEVSRALYEDGLIPHYETNPSDFKINNEEIKSQIGEKANFVENFINQNSEFYLSRLALGSIAEATNDNLELVKKSTLEQILNDDSFIDFAANVLVRSFTQVAQMDKIAIQAGDSLISDGIRKQYEMMNVVQTDTGFDKSKLDTAKKEFYTGE